MRRPIVRFPKHRVGKRMETVREVKAEHTPTNTTTKEKQGAQAINVKYCPIYRKKSAVRRSRRTALFFIFVRKVIY